MIKILVQIYKTDFSSVCKLEYFVSDRFINMNITIFLMNIYHVRMHYWYILDEINHLDGIEKVNNALLVILCVFWLKYRSFRSINVEYVQQYIRNMFCNEFNTFVDLLVFLSISFRTLMNWWEMKMNEKLKFFRPN